VKLQLLTAIALAAVATGCSSTPEFQTGPDAEVTADGLTRLDRTVMDAVWARTDLDFTGINKVRFRSLGVEYRNVDGPYSGRAGTTSARASTQNRSEFQLDEDTRALFEEEISGAFLDEINRSDVFTVVDHSGPDVLDIHVGLLDVVSRVPPETVGRSRIFIDRVGEATLVLEVRDSVSNTALVRAVDRRAAETSTMTESTPPRNRAEVRRLGRRWGQILRDGIDAMLEDGMKYEN
jgi:hypothetical protein